MIHKEKKQVFIGSALTHLPEEIFDEYKGLIFSIADLVEKKYGCTAKYALEHSDPQLAKLKQTDRPDICYKLDRYLVESSDFMIAEASFPSIGLGQELQIAEYSKVPVVFLYKDFKRNIAQEKKYFTKTKEKHSIELGKHKIVSVMALGNPSKIHEIKYTTIKEAITMLDLFLENTLPKVKIKPKHKKYLETLKLIEELTSNKKEFLNPKDN